MDILLSRVTQQAMQYAIRSGISITTGYAIKECSKLLKQAPKSKERDKLRVLQARLEMKIGSIAATIDLVECIAARGNSSLESSLLLTKNLRFEIQTVGNLLKQAADGGIATEAQPCEETDRHLRLIAEKMEKLLASIDGAVPMLHLAISTSGANMSAQLSSTIRPSRLLQASTFLTSADSIFTSTPANRQQVGPTYTVKLYMLFDAHANFTGHESSRRQPTWKEIIHKARVKLWRVPLEHLYALPGEDVEPDMKAAWDAIPAESKAAEFAYQLVIVEDQDDGRYHDAEDSTPFDDLEHAGIRDIIPVHEISKIFYADTGKILGIEGDGESQPILLLKRDVYADPPRRMLQRSRSHVSLADEALRNDKGGFETNDDQSEIDAQLERESTPATPAKISVQVPSADTCRLPADLDPEWMAFEVFAEESVGSQSDDDSADEPSRASTGKSEYADNGSLDAFAFLNLRSSTSLPSGADNISMQLSPNKCAGPTIKTSLSLLEMLLKLTALQQFRQESHLAIEDELINFFLESIATSGAGGDKEYRQRLRRDATRRVGFDPYDESPVKRRGEDYIRNAHNASPHNSSRNKLAYDHAYEYDSPIPTIDFGQPSPIESSSILASSPSAPRPMLYQQTSSRSLTTDIVHTIEPQRSAVQVKYSSNPRSRRSLATPIATTRGGNVALRAHSEPKSELHGPLCEVTNDED